jgi:hypothetical protein
VNEVRLIQGRRIGAVELEQVRQLLADHPDWSRWRLSRRLATLWNWRNGAGQLKDMAARTLLLKLAQRGWIGLPPRRRVPANRMRHKRMPELALTPLSPLMERLEALLPLVFLECSGPGQAGLGHRAVFDALLHQHHYLGHQSAVGENLQYLVRDAKGRPLACGLFGAAAWQCAARDDYIGWPRAVRAQNLHWIANNSRFLVLPWVRVPQLASYVLSRMARRLSGDWQAKYGHGIYLLESFVQRDRFSGAAYRAANWTRVGQTKGRTRQDRPDGTWHQAAIKDVYLYPLHRRFRQHLRGQSFNPNPVQSHDDSPKPIDDPARKTLTPSSTAASP